MICWSCHTSWSFQCGQQSTIEARNFIDLQAGKIATFGLRARGGANFGQLFQLFTHRLDIDTGRIAGDTLSNYRCACGGGIGGNAENQGQAGAMMFSD